MGSDIILHIRQPPSSRGPSSRDEIVASISKPSLLRLLIRLNVVDNLSNCDYQLLLHGSSICHLVTISTLNQYPRGERLKILFKTQTCHPSSLYLFVKLKKITIYCFYCMCKMFCRTLNSTSFHSIKTYGEILTPLEVNGSFVTDFRGAGIFPKSFCVWFIWQKILIFFLVFFPPLLKHFFSSRKFPSRWNVMKLWFRYISLIFHMAKPGAFSMLFINCTFFLVRWNKARKDSQLLLSLQVIQRFVAEVKPFTLISFL